MKKEITKNGYEAATTGWILERARGEFIKGEEEINTMNEVYGKFRNIVGNIDRTEGKIGNTINSIDIDIGDFGIEEKKESTKEINVTEENKREEKDNER